LIIAFPFQDEQQRNAAAAALDSMEALQDELTRVQVT
jgi:hypothetical protein